MFGQQVKISLFGGYLFLLLNGGCNSKVKSGEGKTETTNPTVLTNPKTATDTIFAGDRDTIILLKDGEAFVKGHISADKSQRTYTLPVWKGQTITAILSPAKKGGNVRISQVQKPGGSFDGPFGDSLHYTLKSHGDLRIIIGENLMAGKPYTGDFILHVTVRK